MSANPKIAIAVHSYGYIYPKVYVNHIVAFSQWAKRFNVIFLFQEKVTVAKARNTLVETAISKDCTHILFLDTDHIIDSSLLPHLLGNEDATAVSGLIVKRNGSNNQVGFVKADEDHFHMVNIPIDGKSYQVDVCAFGCTLIKLDIFKHIEEPYFKDIMKRDKEGQLYSQRSDIKFCSDLKALDKIIRIDTRVVVGHVGEEQVYYPEKRDESIEKVIFQLPVYTAAKQLYIENDFNRVLDIGCGNGGKLKTFFSDICTNVIGLENSDKRLEDCQKNFPEGTWIKSDIESEEFKVDADSQTLLICADVLEHLENPKKLLEKIPANVLCIFSTCDMSTVDENVIKVNASHKQIYNKDTFIDLIVNAGFAISNNFLYKESIDYMGCVVVCSK